MARRESTFPLRRIAAAGAFAGLGTALALLLVLSALRGSGRGLVEAISPGAAGPAAAVIHHDFPATVLPRGEGHDGQQFYAIARQPMHWQRVSASLDRPRYRLQRPLFPWLAWLLHPHGGGLPLIVALIAVQSVGLIIGGIAMGLLAARGGHTTAWAAVFPLLPGSLASLRITTADGLASGLLLAVFVGVEAQRPVGAALGAVMAVLTKEVVWAAVFGAAVARRIYRLPAVAGLAAIASWFVVVRTLVPTSSAQYSELAPPLTGLFSASRYWAAGHDFAAAATTAGTLVLAASTVRRRGITDALGSAITCLALVLLVLSRDTLSFDYNGPRTLLPLGALSIAGLLGSPTRGRAESHSSRTRGSAADGAPDGVELG